MEDETGNGVQHTDKQDETLQQALEEIARIGRKPSNQWGDPVEAGMMQERQRRKI